MNAPRPLDGVVVLDLTRILAGPFATQKLGDMGASVWKIERPGTGDDTRSWGPPFHEGLSTYFLAVNRSKRSLTLDLKHPRGLATLEHLVAQADVLIENFRPGTLDKLGLPWSRLQQLNPSLIYASISGYGHTGTHRNRPSYDVIAQGEYGPQDLTGDPDGPPTKFGLSIADITAGQLAVEGILLALLNRARTQHGERVDIALADGLLSLLAYQGQMTLTGGHTPRRMGNAHPSIVPYQAFATHDGWINLGVGSQALWNRFCRAIEHPELEHDPRFATNRDRVSHRAELLALLEPLFAAQPTAHWLTLFTEAGIPNGPIRNVPDALADARADSRGMVTTVQHPEAGPLDMVGNPVKLDSLGPDPDYLPPPLLGQHTDEILAAAGLDPDAIQDLRASGALG